MPKLETDTKEITFEDVERHYQEGPPIYVLFEQLREEGVRVAPSEWLNLQRLISMDLVPDEDAFFVAARSTLIKNAEDLPVFDRIFGSLYLDIAVGIDTKEQSDEELEQDEEMDSENEEPPKPVKPEAPKDVEQKEKENITEVAEASSLNSENMHGGNEATKDILGSPNAAEGGKNSNGSLETSESKDAKGGEDGKSGFAETVPFSAKEHLLRGEAEKFDGEQPLTYEQITAALAKLRAILETSSSERRHTVDPKATVAAICKRGGAPAVMYSDEVLDAPKLLVLFDVGGSTDPYRPMVNMLLRGAKDLIGDLDVYHFHNGIYGEVWPERDGNYPQHPVYLERLISEHPDYKVIIVGDAQMAMNDGNNGGLYDSRNDIFFEDRRSEQLYNDSALTNFYYMQRSYEDIVWLNPIMKREWNKKKEVPSEDEEDEEEKDRYATVKDIDAVMDMFDLSLSGLGLAMKRLMRHSEN